MTETLKRLPWPKPGERQYRIVRDNYLGFEVQMRSFWLPIWHMPVINTRSTLYAAEQLAVKIETEKRTKIVKNIGVISRPNETDT